MSVPVPAATGGDIIAAFGDRQARLEERVTGLEGDLRTVLSAVNGLGDKLDKKGTPQWGVMFTGLGILIGLVAYIGTAWQAPILATMTRQEIDLRVVQAAVVPRSELVEHWRRDGLDAEAQNERIKRLEGHVLVPAWTAKGRS